MRAVRAEAFSRDMAGVGIIEAPMPKPGPGQIRVRMQLAPINPSDLNFIHGTYHQALSRIVWNHDAAGNNGPVFFDPERRDACPVPPYVLGGEGMGIVDAAGPGFLARRLLGQRVAIASGPPNGTWQDYVIADAIRAVSLPDAISDAEGASFFVNPLTALVLVRRVLAVPKGAWLLVTAAGSALGKSLVRLSRVYGYRVICVIRSPSGREALRALGAEAVIATDEEDLIEAVWRITGGAGVSHALDCVGGELSAQVVRCLGRNGRLVLYGTLADAPLSLALRDLMMPMAQISGFILPVWMAQQPKLTLLLLLRQVLRLMRAGMFHSNVAEIVPLEEIGRALQAATAPGRKGKILLRISGG